MKENIIQDALKLYHANKSAAYIIGYVRKNMPGGDSVDAYISEINKRLKQH